MQRDMFCYLKPIVPYTGFRSKMLKSANKTYLIVLCMGRAKLCYVWVELTEIPANIVFVNTVFSLMPWKMDCLRWDLELLMPSNYLF